MKCQLRILKQRGMPTFVDNVKFALYGHNISENSKRISEIIVGISKIIVDELNIIGSLSVDQTDIKSEIQRFEL